jgi:hypothetical protein
MLVASLLFAGVATFAYADADFGRNVTRAGWIWMELMVFVSAFMAGCGLWAMYRAGVAIWRLGARFADKVTVTAGRFGVLSTGSMLAWCWGIIGIVWFMYSLSALLGPGNNELSKMLLSSPVLLIAGPTLPLICGTFIVCQFPLHKGMMAYKRREIRRVERWLDELLSEDKAALTKDKREEIEFLRQRWKELEGLPEWPFSRSAFAGMSGSTVLSVLPVLAKAVELSKPFAKAVTESQVWLR